MPWSNARPNGTRRAAKYGTAHAKARKAAASRHSPTDPCYRCGQPLGPMGRWLHYDHLDDGSGYAGFSHGRCNIQAGARRGAAVVQAQRLAAATADGPACRFCRAPIHAGRTYCSQRCAYLANPERAPRPTQPKPAREPRTYQPTTTEPGRCGICSTSIDPSRRYCSPACRTEANARHSRERYRAKVGLPPTVDRPVKTRHSSARDW